MKMVRLSPALAFAAALCGLPAPTPVQAAGCAAAADETDAVAAAPRNHKVVLENERVRVLEATVPLHSAEPAHTHFWPSVFFEDTSGPGDPAWKNVNLRWSAGGPSKGFANSDRDRHNLLVEIKTAGCEPAPPGDLPETDAVRIHDPNITVALENAYVRVLRVRVPPGDKEPWHTHTWPAVVVYFRLPPSRRMAADGSSQDRAELKQLQVTFDPSSQPRHSVENLGTTMYEAYRIELKPVTSAAAKANR